MFEFHKDRKRYFDIQLANAKAYVLPFIREALVIRPGMRVLEIGCGEGGVLKAFTDEGCVGVGVEMDVTRIVNARLWLEEEIGDGRIRFVTKDIYLADVAADLGEPFDIIVLKDVIEHIHDQSKLIAWMKTFLKPSGIVFFGFPPWQMPFGGHQQISHRKGLSRLPWTHLLPRPLYSALLAASKEPAKEVLLEIYDTRISIERFERLTRLNGYEIVNRRHYLINPIYEWKFGWKPRVQNRLISRIPWLRNFVTTCVFYAIRTKG